MKKLKSILLTIGIIALIGGVLGIGYYIYDSLYYFSTQNASVSSDMVTITPEITGKVTSWDVKEGDSVKSGQILGKQDVSALVTTSALSPQTLGNSADSIISKANIKSPIDGKVVYSDVVAGQVIAPGTDIAVIADTSHFYIKANIEETDIFRIKQGQKVDIHIDAYPNRDFEGYVESISQATESAFSQTLSLNTSGTYSKVTQLIEVRISINNVEQIQLMPGMNATVKIHVK